MLTVTKAFSSSIGRKILMGLSGLGLVGFVLAHLAGNLTLLIPGGDAFNAYAKKLHDLGPVLIVMEVGLIGMFFLHIITAVTLKANHRAARPQGYAVYRSKGGPSFSSVASLNMIFSGALILAFLVFHIWHFKYGPGLAEGYVTQVAGNEARDLYKLVYESFKQPLYVGVYVAAMLFLGFHLRHGFWSAFQSLGLMNPRFTKPVYALGLMIAMALAVGFLIIPLYIYFFA